MRINMAIWTLRRLLPNKNLCRVCGGINLQSGQFLEQKSFSKWTQPLLTLQQIPLTQKEMKIRLHEKPQQPDNPHSLNVSIIGAPNAGKSTLANRILGHRFSSVSAKVHTTRQKTLGVFTQENVQVTFLDTPGLINSLIKKRHNLEESLLIDPHISLVDADLLMVVVDGSPIWGRERLDPMVLQVLHVFRHKPSILVINKVDLVNPKTKLLNATRRLTDGLVNNTKNWKHITKDKKLDVNKLIEGEDDLGNNENNSENVAIDCSEKVEHDQSGVRNQDLLQVPVENDKMEWWQTYRKMLDDAKYATRDKSGWEHFKQIFMVSALNGDGIEDIRDYLCSVAKPGEWKYSDEVVTDQNPIRIAVDCVREKLLDHLPKEIPYSIGVRLVIWEEDESGYLRAAFDIVCKRKRDYKYTLGPKGKTIQTVSTEAKRELMNTFHRDLSLKLAVVLEED